MKRILMASVAVSSLCAACKQTEPAAGSSKIAPPSASIAHDERMQWWRDARFGMFIHWGLYAIPAGEWGTRTDHGEWIRTSAQIPLEEYDKLQPRFNPVKFDADAWARMAADAGMKYLVITSKHHDGFGLFDSALTDWDVINTPFARDILKELSAACERHGVRFCTYHSIMDWHHPDYLPRREWETTRSTAGADYDRFERYLHGQVTEVVKQYRPAVMWFDGEWENTWTHERGVRLFNLCRELDPAMIVNNRVDVHRGGMAGFSRAAEAVGDFGTPEQEIPATGMAGVDWETCMTMNDHWGFNSRDANWKSTQDCVRMLADIASKGGNYLLNVGPRADGTFPPEAVERLREIGVWMKRHGDAIHSTSASPFDSFEWGRCTVQQRGEDTTLYLLVFEAPTSGEIVLPGLANEVQSAGWLAGPRVQLPVERRGTDVVVKLAGALPDALCSVITLGIRGAPLVYRAPVIEAASNTFVNELEVTLSTPSEQLEIRYTLDDSEPTARSPRYDRRLKLTGTTTVNARSFHDGKAVSAVTTQRFERVTPRPAVQQKLEKPGLHVQMFPGEWDVLPDFTPLIASDFDFTLGVAEPAAPNEKLALRLTGQLEVPRDELYVFALTSDDGARLWIDGELVVDNDGLHGAVEKRGTLALAAGRHAIEIGWFNKSGGAELDLKLAPLGETLAAIPAAALTH